VAELSTIRPHNDGAEARVEALLEAGLDIASAAARDALRSSRSMALAWAIRFESRDARSRRVVRHAG